MRGVGGLYSVRLTESSDPDCGSFIKCKARGAFRHDGLSPLPGDTVVLVPTEERGSDNYVIDKIEARKNFLIRPPMANLDYLFITMAARSPMPCLTTVDKLIAIAEHNRIEPVILITKNELDPDYASALADIYTASGFICFSVSAVESRGIEAVDKFIKENMNGRIAAFAGASGIGKSTLLNKLFPDLELSTSEISRKIERGRHTTRAVELYCLGDGADCGYIADTPGFSMLDFERFDFFEKEDLPLTFREFDKYIGLCRYTKCTHTKEDGCAIVEAVKRGDIPLSRHESYCQLFDTLKAKKKWN